MNIPSPKKHFPPQPSVNQLFLPAAAHLKQRRAQGTAMTDRTGEESGGQTLTGGCVCISLGSVRVCVCVWGGVWRNGFRATCLADLHVSADCLVTEHMISVLTQRCVMKPGGSPQQGGRRLGEEEEDWRRGLDGRRSTAPSQMLPPIPPFH